MVVTRLMVKTMVDGGDKGWCDTHLYRRHPKRLQIIDGIAEASDGDGAGRRE